MKKAEVVSTFGMEGKWVDVLKKIDLDNNGSIDYEEWITAAIDKQKVCTAENIKKAFDLLGGSNDGYIDVGTFKEKMPSRNQKNMKPENSK